MKSSRGRAEGRAIRQRRIRRRIIGLPDRPRLAVFRSQKHLYAQIVDDVAGKTLVGCSTLSEPLAKMTRKGTVSAATEVGKLLAAEATKIGISKVVFDRAGYKYSGRVKALAEAARGGGLSF